MEKYTIYTLLEYLFNRFLFVFIICLIGSFSRDCIDTLKNLNKINIKKILISTIFSSIIICAIMDIFDFKVSTVILLCFFSGLWSFKMLEAITNWNYVKIFIKNICKNVKNAACNAIANTMDEIDKEKKDINKDIKEEHRD